MTTLPVALDKDPIASAIFEIRFSSSVNGVADILPGLMFQKLGDRYPRAVTLPAGEIPAALRGQLPNSEYQSVKSLVGNRTSINFAERSLTVEVLRPYWGWKKFKILICEILEAVRDTGLVSRVDRCSLRYINVLDGIGSNIFDALKVSGSVGDFKIGENGFHLRVETELTDGLIAIVQLNSSASVDIRDDISAERLNGILLDVDCVYSGQLENFWSEFSRVIEMIHDQEKRVFFGMLNESTLKVFGPKWE